ncbi:MAG: hypothetical protein CME39_09760 [Haliea sp.]|nr:hypothetical protein [Haliea sp.]
MPSFEGVAAGATATLRLPIGLTYEQLLISYSGVTLAQLTEIRVVGNGKTFQRFTSGTRLDAINQFNGRAAAAGVLVIDFTRYGLRTRQGEEITGLGTGMPSQDGSVELSTLAVEIDIAAAASAPVLSAKAVQSDRSPLGLIRWVREFGHSPAASGEYEIADIPKGHLFNQVHFFSGDMSALRIERDGYTVFERNAAENALIQSDGVRVPQSGVFSFDPTETGNGGETLQTAGVFDLRFVCKMDASGSLPVVVESIAPLA